MRFRSFWMGSVLSLSLAVPAAHPQEVDLEAARTGLVHVGDAFRHDLGFVRRRGIATLFGGYDRVFRPANTNALLREHTLGVDVDATEAGEHSFDTLAIDYRSDQSAMLSVGAGIEAGEYWTGTQRVADGSLRFRLNEHVAASASLTRNTIALPQGTLRPTSLASVSTGRFHRGCFSMRSSSTTAKRIRGCPISGTT